MKLIQDPKWPEWLKRDPVSGYWRVVQYRADKTPQRLDKSTGEKVSIERAKTFGRRIYEAWIGERIDGSKLRPLFGTLCDEVLRSMEAKLAAGKIRPGTLQNAKDYLGKEKSLREEFGHLYVDQITETGAWGKFVTRFQLEHPTMTLYNQWKHMSLVMRHAYKSGHRERVWEAENPDPKRNTGRVLSDAEKTALLEHARPDLRDQLVMAMTMGMRLREILKLEWARVDFEADTITLRDQDVKTRKGRVMAMSPQVHQALEQRRAGFFVACDGYRKRRKATDSPYVFPARNNHERPAHQNKSAWRTAKLKAGIEGRCRFHHLRHTFLTECANLLRAGDTRVSVVHICAYAGLSIRTFERVYLHLDHNDTCGVSKLLTVKLRENKAPTELTK